MVECMEVPRWRPGDVILDLYQVMPVVEAGRRAGAHQSGGMGLVYRLRHLGWGMDLALKIPRETWLRSPEQVGRFEQEAALWIRVGLHPHVVTCHYV
jgi:hypothetical protein